jgi:nitroreductase
MSDSFLDNLKWRYAVKEFKQGDYIDSEYLKDILKAVKYTPTSFGLQPYHVYVVSNKDTLNSLYKASFNQTQIKTCEYLLVFCAKTDVQKRTGDYIKVASKELGLKGKIKLKGFEAMVRGFFTTKDHEYTLNWAKNQAYIALGFALAAAAELKVDSAPMEGFNPKKFAEILKVKKDETPCVILAIGVRKENPSRKKVRFSKKDLLTFVD